MSHTARIILALAALVFLMLAVGFVGFARDVATAKPPSDPRADGIVVLTGGTARIDGALQLLVEGRASRLLISGVNPKVTPDILAETVAAEHGRQALACCVDLGHDARDTVGNAAETRAWIEARGYSSLIVVTSDYHMARSMAELATAMPAIRLIAYPVSNPDLHLGDWWTYPQAFGLLVREYVKFLSMKVRLAVAPATVAAGG